MESLHAMQNNHEVRRHSKRPRETERTMRRSRRRNENHDISKEERDKSKVQVRDERSMLSLIWRRLHVLWMVVRLNRRRQQRVLDCERRKNEETPLYILRLPYRNCYRSLSQTYLFKIIILYVPLLIKRLNTQVKTTKNRLS